MSKGMLSSVILSETTTTRGGSSRISPFRLDNQIQKSESKQYQHIAKKSDQLIKINSCLKADNQKLREQNKRLINLNSEYLSCVNKFYQERMDKLQKIVFPVKAISGEQLDPLLKEALQKTITSFKRLQTDHLQLTKHCSIIEKQNKFLKKLLQELNQIKVSLIEVNHTDVKKMATQLKEVQKQNQELRNLINDKCYQIQKQNLDLQKSTVLTSRLSSQNQKMKREIDENRGKINQFDQQLKNSNYKNQRKLFVLETKCAQFQKNSSEDIKEVQRIKKIARNHRIQNVELFVRQNNMCTTINDLITQLENKDSKRINTHRRMSCSTIKSKKGHKSSSHNKSVNNVTLF